MAKIQAVFDNNNSLGTIGSSISQAGVDSMPIHEPDAGLAQALNGAELELAAREQDMIDYANNASRVPSSDSVYSNENNENTEYYRKLAKHESGGMGGYTASNKSGAYGKYQFMPATEKEVAAKLGYTIEQARTPDGQEAMIRQFTKDNIAGLRRNGIPVNDETLWWAHNQGLGGAINLHKGIPLSAKNLKANGAPSGTNAEYIAKWSPSFRTKTREAPSADKQIGLSETEMSELDQTLGRYAYVGG